MLTLSMGMAIVIGVALFLLGRRGNIMWMKAWSVMLVVLGVGYLIADGLGLGFMSL